jgi:hypothetical protein
MTARDRNRLPDCTKRIEQIQKQLREVYVLEKIENSAATVAAKLTNLRWIQLIVGYIRTKTHSASTVRAVRRTIVMEWSAVVPSGGQTPNSGDSQGVCGRTSSGPSKRLAPSLASKRSSRMHKRRLLARRSKRQYALRSFPGVRLPPALPFEITCSGDVAAAPRKGTV